jgi:hypothetical protein
VSENQPETVPTSATKPAEATAPANSQEGADASEGTVHQPSQVLSDLAEKLGARHRHVVFLLGAGASCAAGLPDLAGLLTAVGRLLTGAHKSDFERLATGRNIEGVLTHLRLIAALGATDKIDGLDVSEARALDTAICRAIASVISESEAVYEHHARFGRWLARNPHERPIELFTTNYDLLIEKGLEQVGCPYFDGFVGILEGRFRSDLVDGYDESVGLSATQPPTSWARLWKLHGSVSWRERESEGDTKAIVRTTADSAEESLAIYPSFEKYQQSRRLPFVALSDRFRRSLAIPETFALIVGYSFGDEHINELLFDAAQLHPATEVMCLFHGELPDSVVRRSLEIPNLVAIGRSEGIIGGVRGRWASLDDDQLKFTAGDQLLLGDFRVFTKTLIREEMVPEPSAPSSE